MSLPRVLCIVQLPPPVHGASVMNNAVVNSRLLAEQFELDVLPLRFAETIDGLGGVSSRKLVAGVLTGARLFSALARRKPAIAYFTIASTGAAFYRDCAYVGLIRLFGVPRMLHVHGMPQCETWMQRALFRWITTGSCVIQLSQRVAMKGAGNAHMVFVGNGVEDRAQDRTNRNATSIPTILFLSNMLESKGPIVLLDALAVLKRRGLPFRAVFAGAPVHECPRQFEQHRAELDLEEVEYIGPVFGSAKDACFAEADIFVLPTFYEREVFPLVILEAMQYGLPVVSTFQGAIPDVVVDGETGFLVPARDANALAERLEQLVVSRTLRGKMGAMARARYLAEYTLDQFERQLAGVFHANLRTSATA